MSITDSTPSWLKDLVREVGPVVVGELVKVGADWITSGKPPRFDSQSLLEGARRVRDILPDPLPNVAVDDRADREIARREASLRDRAATDQIERDGIEGKPFAGILGAARENDHEADTDPLARDIERAAKPTSQP